MTAHPPLRLLSLAAQAALTTLAMLLLAGAHPAQAADTSAPAQLQRWQAEAGNPPTTPQRHASTGKAIAPLAPAMNAERFTRTAKVDKWFKRNCNDALARECTAQEKADVLAWLITLK